MAERLLVCVSALQVTVALCRRRRLVDCTIFPNDESGLDAFDAFLAPYAGVPACLMADVVEEDYRFETLPHAFGADRRDLVQRKLKQHYRNTPYVAACLLGRESGKRRDDRYLFSALTNPVPVAPWVQAIAAHGMAVAGIFLLPIVSTTLFTALRIKATNVLLVSRQSGGLRLTFFREGQLHLSRLTQGDSAKADDPARFIADEISTTRIYLHALRATRLDEQLTLLLLDRDDTLTEATHTIARDNPSLDCVRLGRRDLSAVLRIAEPVLDLSADAIYLQLLAIRTPHGNLAPPSVTAGYRRLQLRRAVYAAAGVAAIAGVAWSGVNLWETADTHARIDEARDQTVLLQVEYRDITRQFPAAPTTAQNLRRTVELARQLREGVRTPEPFMRVVSAALDATPGIVVSALSWKYGTGDVDAGADAGTRRPASHAPSGRRQGGIIEGEIKPFRGDFRGAVVTINEFTARLNGDPAVAEARVVKLPLNVDPALALSGNTLDSRDQPGSADFRVMVVLKPNQ